jgi:uncharacterized protein (DUF927 family)
VDIDNLNEKSILDDEIFKKIFAISDNLERTKLIVKLQEKSRKLKVSRSFNNMLKTYQQNYIQETKRTRSNRPIKFEELNIEEISPGEWTVDYFGVYKYKLINFENTKIVACPHPILPVERLINIDTNIEKIKLAFYKDKQWKYVITEKNTIASKSKILQLANRGIEVNENNAKELITYLSDIINLNIDKIPYNESITHLGWINKDEFTPYSDEYKYDGDTSYSNLFESVTTNGDYEKWKTHVRELRKNSNPLRFMIASSFASVLVKIFKINPFIVHLWGKSGNGKTVSQMVCASIWGNPSKGKLVSSLDNTKVALERMLNFMRNLPLIADELQLIKNSFISYDTLIYILTEGKGKDRGTVDNGLTNVTEWDNIIITSGEEPITGSNSKEGVKNRVFEIEENNVIVENGRETVSLIQSNYGFAGKEFVEIIKKKENLFEEYNQILSELKDKTKSKKQLNAMACILVADKVVSEFIFEDEVLKIEEIKDYFTKDIDEVNRYIELITDWFYQNINKFYYDNNTINGEIYGTYIKEGEIITQILVIPNVLKDFLLSQNINFNGIKSKLFDEGYLEKNSQGRYVHQTTVKGIKQNLLKIKIKNVDISNKNEDLPF